jgi:hypothetical protein
VYQPGAALLDGDDPYDVDRFLATRPVGQEFPLYAPHSLLVGAAVAVLPIEAARVVWGAAMLATLTALVAVGLRWAGRRPTVAAVLAVTALVLLSTPGRFSFQTGQSTPLLALGVVVALRYAAVRPELAGIGLAVSLVKPVYGLPTLALLLVHRCHRAAVVGVGVAALLSLPVLTVLVVDEGGIGPFVETIRDNVEHTSSTSGMDPVDSTSRIDVHSLLAKVWSPLGAGALSVVAAAAVIGLAAASTSVRRRISGWPLESGVLLLAVTVGLVHQLYDLLALVPAVLALLLAAGVERRGRLAAWVVLGAAFSPLGTEYVVDRLDGSLRTAVVGSTALLLVVAFGLVVAAARSAPQADPTRLATEAVS